MDIYQKSFFDVNSILILSEDNLGHEGAKCHYMPLIGGWGGNGVIAHTFSFLTLHFLYIMCAFWLFGVLGILRKNELHIQDE